MTEPERRASYASNEITEGTIVRAGVAVAVRDERRRVLLEKRSDSGMWGFPGGRIDAGESILTTAHREVLEETGLTVHVTGMVGVYSEPAERIVTFPDNRVQLVDILLEAEIVSGELVCSEESEELRFFDPAQPPADLVPAARMPLRDVAEGARGLVR